MAPLESKIRFVDPNIIPKLAKASLKVVFQNICDHLWGVGQMDIGVSLGMLLPYTSNTFVAPWMEIRNS